MNTNATLQRTLLFLVCLLTLTIYGCEKDDDVSYKVDDFVGSWIATSYVHSDNAGQFPNIDLIALGGEIRFTMLEDGRTRTWVEVDTFSDEWDALVTISGNTLTSTPQEAARGVDKMTFEYDGTTLTLTNKNNEFDFTLGMGTPVSSTSVGTFVRH